VGTVRTRSGRSARGARRAHGAGPGGFTLVELVATIAVAAVVVSFMALFVVAPVRAYDDQVRRAELVDAADAALRGIARDLRAALHHSVRVTNVDGRVALEFLAAVDAARYRDGALGDAALELDLAAPDGEFTTATRFTAVARPFDSTRHRLAIYHVGVPGADAWEGDAVMTPAGARIRIDDDPTGGSRVRVDPAMRFAWGSPGKRVYLVSTPVTYLCDPAARTLVRWSDYPVRAAPRTSTAEFAAAGAVAGRVARDLAGCAIEWSPGTPERAGLVTLALRLERDGERVELLHQVHLPNAP
jgi:MSHA biogenesis protein MshO